MNASRIKFPVDCEGESELEKWIRLPILTFLGSAFAAVAHLLGDSAFRLLSWRAGTFETGELWRFVSGHFVHVSFSHFCYDVGAFALLGIFVEGRSRAFFVSITLGTIGLSSVFLEWTDRFSVYCGLSGVGMGLLVGSAVVLFREGRSRQDWVRLVVSLVAFVLAVAKVLWELFVRRAFFLEEELGGFAVAVEAHLAGVLAALVFWL